MRSDHCMASERYLNHPTFGMLYRVAPAGEGRDVYATLYAQRMRQLGFKAGFGLVLAVGERLLANILLRAEQGADALVARGGRILGPSYFRMPPDRAAPLLNGLATVVLVLVIGLRGQYGAL